MPMTVSRFCATTGSWTTIWPIAAAWLLIRYIRMPLLSVSWNASESFWAWSNMSLRRSRTIHWSILVERYSFQTSIPPDSRVSMSVANTANAIRDPVLEPKIPVTQPGADLSPMMLSTVNASGHGCASATRAVRIVRITETTASFRYGFR